MQRHLTCSLGTVAVGGDASVVIQVIPNQAGTLTDAASVTGSLSDPDPSNNSASVTVSVYTGKSRKPTSRSPSRRTSSR